VKHFSWPIIVIDDRFNVLLNETDMKLIGKGAIKPQSLKPAWFLRSSLAA